MYCQLPTCSSILGTLLGYYLIFYGIKNSEAADGKIWNDTWTDHLRQDLLTKYDKFARPNEDYNTIRVGFTMEPYYVSIDDFQSAVNIMAYTKMRWNDEKLKWNASKYGQIYHLQVGSHEIWQPDITLDKSLGNTASLQDSGTPCFVLADGTVACETPLRLRVLCDLDHHHWPFDTQNCTVSMFSWAGGPQIDLQFLILKDLGDSEELIQNGEWELKEMSKLREVNLYTICCMQPSITLHYNLVMKRNSGIYRSVIIPPTVFIVLLNLVNFWIPPHSKKKLIICTLLALIICIFLAYLGEKIPSFSSKPPLIVSFYSGCLYQVTISLIISVAVINLSRRRHCQPLSRPLMNILLGKTGKYLGLSDHIHQIKSQQEDGEEELREPSSHSFSYVEHVISNNTNNINKENVNFATSRVAKLEWILVSTAIDRITFLIFCNVFVLMSITCIP